MKAKQKKSETVMKQIGVVAVDSGQLLIVDPCRAVGNRTLTYDEMCEVTLGPDGGGQARKVTNEDGTEDGWKTGIAGVVSGTAYGDDLYPVFQVYEDEQLVGLYVELDGLYYGGPGGPGEMLRNLRRERNTLTENEADKKSRKKARADATVALKQKFGRNG